MIATLLDVDVIALVDDVRAGEMPAGLNVKLPHALPLCRNKVGCIPEQVG